MCCLRWAWGSTKRSAACDSPRDMPRPTMSSISRARSSLPCSCAPAPVRSVEEELARRLSLGEEVLLAPALTHGGAPPPEPGAELPLARACTVAATVGCGEFDAAAMTDASGIAEAGAPV